MSIRPAITASARDDAVVRKPRRCHERAPDHGDGGSTVTRPGRHPLACHSRLPRATDADSLGARGWRWDDCLPLFPAARDATSGFFDESAPLAVGGADR